MLKTVITILFYLKKLLNLMRMDFTHPKEINNEAGKINPEIIAKEQR